MSDLVVVIDAARTFSSGSRASACRCPGPTPADMSLGLSVCDSRWDRVLLHNASARVFHSNQSLVLQKVTRHSSGRYACSALNAEGETVSNELHFRVKCEYWTETMFRVKWSDWKL
ncbi:unnamed protein product [Plutella xylostella]|uniref:(diamondback moth) hypothetical protein n=1 Tax=Plutella xylostella TaxID=51655 RepID=A0A8S4G1X2_PLUXY|nr:unnamed protein product [Plutella xylostella]